METIFYTVGVAFIGWLFWVIRARLADFPDKFEDLSKRAIAAQKTLVDIQERRDEETTRAKELSALIGDVAARLKPMLSNLAVYYPPTYRPAFRKRLILIDTEQEYYVGRYDPAQGFVDDADGAMLEILHWAYLPDLAMATTFAESFAALNDVAYKINDAFGIDLHKIGEEYERGRK